MSQISSKMMPMRRTIKNVVKNYSSVEVKVREATSNDPWGPSSTMMSEIAEMTYQPVALGQIMAQIWKRLNDHGKNWRHVYKALVLLEYLIRSGSEQVASQCKQNIFAIQTLKDFQYLEDGKDHGLNVREKAKQVVSLLRDDEKLRNERSKAAKARERLYLGGSGNTSRSTQNIFALATSSSRNGYEIDQPNSPVRRDSAVTRQHVAATGPNARASHSGFPDSRRRSVGDIRPSDPTEEDMQLQLALQLSQQEHEAQQRLQKQEELKLQMAIEASRKDSQVAPPRSAVNRAQEDLLGLSLDEPYASIGSVSRQPPQASLANFGDPWARAAPAQADPFDPFAGNRLPRSQSDSANSAAGAWKVFEFDDSQHGLASDPFAQPAPAEAPEFDVFSYRSAADKRPASMTPAVAPPPQTWGTFEQAGSFCEPLYQQVDDDPFGAVTLTSQQVEAANRQKTPQEFLGENSKLVNLDALVARPPLGATNPFTTLSVSGPQQFQPAPNKVPISQLMQQKQMPAPAAAPVYGNLQAPLIALPSANGSNMGTFSATGQFGMPNNGFGAATGWPMAAAPVGMPMAMQPAQPQSAYNPFM